MDITTLAAWGEFLGGIAVVISLVYLASQIRQNSRLLTASVATTTEAANTSLSTLIVQDPDLGRIWWDGMADREALSEPDRRRFDPLISIQVSGFQHQFRLARKGVLDPEVLADLEQGTRFDLQQPGFLEWWREWGERAYSGDFGDYMNGLIREGETAG
jgi:hypothetical protein